MIAQQPSSSIPMVQYDMECSLSTLSGDISKKKHSGPIHTIKFSRSDGQYCMTAGADKTIKLFNPFKTFMVLAEYKGHGYEVFDIDIAEDNNTFISGSGDKAMFLWDVSTGEIKRRFKDHKGKVNCVKFSKNNQVCMSGSYDRTLKIWDLRSSGHKPIQTISSFKDSVSCVNGSETSIFAGCVDGSVHVYDVRNGKETVDHMGASIGHISLTSDALCYCCSSLDSTISLVEIESGRILRNFTGHLNTKYQIKHALSNDDKYLFSGDENGKIYRWDLATENIKEVKNRNTEVVETVQNSQFAKDCEIIAMDYHPKEHFLITGAVNANIQLWNLT